MADYRARQRVQIHDGTDEFGVLLTKPIFVKLSDGTTALSIDSNGNAGTSIYTPNGDSAMDDVNDAVQVSIVAGSVVTEYAEDAVAGSGDNGIVSLVVRKDSIGSNVSADGDYATLLQDANGRLYVQIHDGNNSITVDDGDSSLTVDGTVDVGTLSTITNVVHIDDNGSSITVDGTVAVSSVAGTVTVSASQLDIDNLNLTDDAVQVSGNSSPNSEVNPIYVQVVSGITSGVEKHDYDTATVAKDGTDNHDYTVTGSKTFLLKSILVSASGAMKVIVQVGPVAGLVTKAVVFTSAAKPTEQVIFDPPIEIPDTSTGTIRLARRNDDNSSMDVYSTIIGTEI